MKKYGVENCRSIGKKTIFAVVPVRNISNAPSTERHTRFSVLFFSYFGISGEKVGKNQKTKIPIRCISTNWVVALVPRTGKYLCKITNSVIP